MSNILLTLGLPQYRYSRTTLMSNAMIMPSGVLSLYSEQIGLRNSTQLGVLWIPAFAGMTVIEFFANHSVWSIKQR